MIAVGFDAFSSERHLVLALTFVTVFLFTAAANTLNDYFDRNVDKVSHPNRPIPSGRVSPQNALLFSLALTIPFFPLSLMINVECFLVILAAEALIISYEKRFKREGLIGNLQISLLGAFLFLYGGFAAYGGDFNSIARAGVAALLAFLAMLGREITKDIEDMAGDLRERKTLPMRIGVSRAGAVGASAFILASVLSLLPYLLGILGLYYLLLVLVADGIFVTCALLITSRPAQISNLSKVGMAVAFVAFAAGVLLPLG